MKSTTTKRNKSNPEDTTIRTTVRFSGTIREMAEAQMEVGGYNGNLTAFLSDLVRRNGERLVELDLLQRHQIENASTKIAKRIIRAVRSQSGLRMLSLSELRAHESGSPGRVVVGFGPPAFAASASSPAGPEVQTPSTPHVQ